MTDQFYRNVLSRIYVYVVIDIWNFWFIKIILMNYSYQLCLKITDFIFWIIYLPVNLYNQYFNTTFPNVLTIKTLAPVIGILFSVLGLNSDVVYWRSTVYRVIILIERYGLNHVYVNFFCLLTRISSVYLLITSTRENNVIWELIVVYLIDETSKENKSPTVSFCKTKQEKELLVRGPTGNK